MSTAKPDGAIAEFAETTSLHGIKNVVIGSRSCRCIWSVALLACMIVCGLQLSTLCYVYSSYQTMTTIEISSLPTPFPAVTICNLNNYRRSKIPGVVELQLPLALYEQIATTSILESVAERRKRLSPTTSNTSVHMAATSTSSKRNQLAVNRPKRWAENPDCPSGFVEHFWMCYYLDPDTLLSYEEMKTFCTGIGARLPVLRRKVESKTLAKIFKKLGTISSLYLGMDKADDNTEYRMHDTLGIHKMDSKFNAADLRVENCVLFYPANNTWPWQTATCTSRQPIFCQAPIVMNYTFLNGHNLPNDQSPTVSNTSTPECLDSCSKMMNCAVVEIGFKKNIGTICQKACSYVGYISHGNIPLYDTLLTSVGTIVSFSCLPGFVMFGSATTICLSGGVWNNPNPHCKIACPILDLEPKIIVTYTNIDRTSDVLFSCSAANSQDSYIITPASSTCLHDGTWRLPLPPKCTCISTILDVPQSIKSSLNQLESQLEQIKHDNEALKQAMKDSLPYFSHFVPKQQLGLIGHQLSDMVSSCTIQGARCKASDFKSTLDAAFGNCYTLNDQNTDTLMAHRAGVDQGISLELNVETNEYLTLTDQVGMVVIVHDQNETIIPETVRYAVASGTSTSIAMQRTKVWRMQRPYSNCEYDTAPFDNLYNTSYSAEGCFKSCQQKNLIVKCGCGDPRIPIPNNSKHCSIANIDCVREFYATQHSVECNCPQPCHSTAVSMVASQLKWNPNEISKQTCGDIQDGNRSSCIRQIERNKLSLQIYLSDIKQVIYREKPMSSLVELISGFGGTLGLFIGSSALTFVELLKLIFDLTTSCIKR